MLTVLGEAERFGAVCANRVDVTGLLEQRRAGARACACATARAASEFEVRAANVVNATGVWADELRPRGAARRGGAAAHPPEPRHAHHARATSDLPLVGGAIVPAGERALDLRAAVARAHAGRHDRQRLRGRARARRSPPARTSTTCSSATNDVLRHDARAAATSTGAFAGVRPLISTGDPKKSVDISRKAELYETSSGMITITGGKLTTWRRMAKMTVDRLVEREAPRRALPHARDPARPGDRRRGAAARGGRARGVLRGARRPLRPRRARRARARRPSAASWRSRSSPACPTCSPRSRSRRATSRRAASATCCCAARGWGCSRRASCRRAGGRGPVARVADVARAASSAGTPRASQREIERFAEEARAEGLVAASSRREIAAARRLRAVLRACGARARARRAAVADGDRQRLAGLVQRRRRSAPTLDAQVRAGRGAARGRRGHLDIGGESATTGRPPVAAEEEIERVVPLDRARRRRARRGRLGRHLQAAGRARGDRRRARASSTTSAACATPSSPTSARGRAPRSCSCTRAPRRSERCRTPSSTTTSSADVLDFLRERIDVARDARRRAPSS